MRMVKLSDYCGKAVVLDFLGDEVRSLYVTNDGTLEISRKD